MPRAPEVCSHVFTIFSQFSNGLEGYFNVLPLRRLIAAFSRRIFLELNNHLAFRQSLTTACLLLFLVTYDSSLISTPVQSTTASLRGTVIVQNNALVPNVRITVMSIGQRLQRSATTNEEGAFVVLLLLPGKLRRKSRALYTSKSKDVIVNANAHVGHCKASQSRYPNKKSMKKLGQKPQVIMHSVDPYPYRKQRGFIVKEMQWWNLKTKIKSISLPSRSLESFFFMFIGIACSAFLALPGFKTAQTVPNYVWIISWVVMITASLLAYGFHHLSKHQKASSTQSITDILETMSIIEQEFNIPTIQKPEALPPVADAVQDQASPGTTRIL